jgi:hypothetical protein
VCILNLYCSSAVQKERKPLLNNNENVIKGSQSSVVVVAAAASGGGGGGSLSSPTSMYNNVGLDGSAVVDDYDKSYQGKSFLLLSSCCVTSKHWNPLI